MQDRVSRYPGRYKISKVSNGIYNLERADEPSQVGTILNKANLLSDATATKLGLTSDATPNDAFNKLADGGGVISVDDDGTVRVNSENFRILKQPSFGGSARLYIGAGGGDYINTDGLTRELTIRGYGGIKLETEENKSVTINGKEIGAGGGGNVEVGTWTPRFFQGNFTNSLGLYIKSGNICVISWYATGTCNETSEYFQIADFPMADMSVNGAKWYAGGGNITGVTTFANQAFCGYTIEQGYQTTQTIHARTASIGANTGVRSSGYCGTQSGKTVYTAGTIAYKLA